MDAEDHENSPSPTPIRVKPRRFMPSPDKRPLKEVVPNGEAVTAKSTEEVGDSNEQHVSIDSGAEQSGCDTSKSRTFEKGPQDSEPATNQNPKGFVQDHDSVQNPMGDDEMEEFLTGIENAIQDASPAPEVAPVIATKANKTVPQSIEPTHPSDLQQKSAVQPKNERKRKSEEMEEERAATSSKKPAKKSRATKAEVSKAKGKQKAAPIFSQEYSAKPVAVHPATTLMPARLPGLTKHPNTHLSQRQQAELDQIIEKVKARPGKLKTLYVLKREKSKKIGADDVRSGRAVVKPLAYWSAEQCVHNDGGAAGLELGARIPISSVQEITRGNKKTTRIDEDSSEDEEDKHGEPWEKEIGVFRGQASVWSQSHQTTLEDAEETDLAFHPSAMLTTEVSDSKGFKFAKVISNPFFGSGILDLAPGAAKRPKNSRTMHMCFFVHKGRVTVTLGSGTAGEEGERFSVGKGGLFQVPRGTVFSLCCFSSVFPWKLGLTSSTGNKYSIENVLEKPARIFFSQGSETAPEG